MKEKILKIEDSFFKDAQNDWPYFEGFQVITDKQTIKLGISNTQQCCENWGYFFTNDDIREFIGSEIFNIEIVDESLNNIEFKNKAGDLYEGDVMFVNISTNKGILQFTAYNNHNGHYSHEATVISEQLTCRRDL